MMTGMAFGQMLCAAFGLDPKTVKQITINSVPMEMPQVDVTFLVHDEQGRAIAEIVKRYELIEKVE